MQEEYSAKGAPRLEIKGKNNLNLGYLNFLMDRDFNDLNPLRFPNLNDSTSKIYPLWFYSGYQKFINSKLIGTVGSNKFNDKSTFNCMKWFPNGRGILLGLSSGDLIAVDAYTFQKEKSIKPFQPEIVPIRSIAFTHSGKHVLAGVHIGLIKILDANTLDTKNTISTKLSELPNALIREISIAPTDLKFVTCSDHKELNVYDLETGSLDKSLTGHGNNVTSCEWHPSMSLVASASKDNSVKLWCPKKGCEEAIIQKHNNCVNKVRWNQNGNWLLSCGKDLSIKLFDIRKNEQEIFSYKNECEVNVISWNPFNERLFASGDSDGNICYWSTEDPTCLLKIGKEMKSKIFELAWNPTSPLLSALYNKNIDFLSKGVIYPELNDNIEIKNMQDNLAQYLTKASK